MLILGVLTLNWGKLVWADEPHLQSLELILSIFLGQNIFAKLVAIYSKVHNSLMKMTVTYWILQFMLFEGILLGGGSIAVAIIHQEEITNKYKMDFLLLIQFIELIRLIICFCKTRELTILSRGIERIFEIFLNIFRPEPSQKPPPNYH